MSDKKEIVTLSIKISVDSTDLDKLESQLKRIEGLMVSVGVKEPAKQGFTADIGVFNPKGCLEPVFTVSSGVAYINEACIEKTTLEKAMIQAAKEGAKKGAEQARFEITTGVNYDREQLSVRAKLDDTEREIKEKETDAAGILNGISEALHNSGNKAVIAALNKAIDINTPVSRDEFEDFKAKIEAELSNSQALILAIQHSQFSTDMALAEAIEQNRAEIQNK